MAIKKTTKPIRPGQGQPGGPPNPNKMQVSSGVTVLGGKLFNNYASTKPRQAFTNAQMAELKKMLAKIEADKKAVSKSSKKDAKIVKSQNKKPLVTGRGATKPVTAASLATKKKPVIKVTPRGGRGGGGMLGGIFGTKNR